ncbi:hypothetical protein ACIQU6_41695 [Streptomyces sp. NPDC090442]|uniref:hypothetical protein n=1 Tax=Streptomyces sp. NPDC090442 TaxID=3365962 RepID=UPI003813DEA5
MAMQRKSRGYGGYGYGVGMGASPMISYRVMQWAQLQLKIGQAEFTHTEITPQMLSIGRRQIQARRHWSAAGWLLGLGAVWLLLWWLAPLVDVLVTAAAAAALLALAWAQGRRPTRRRPPVPKLLFVAPKTPAHADQAADPEPYPIREAGRSPREAREAIRLALRAHRAPVAEVGVPEPTDWGWTAELVLKGGTLEQLSALLPTVATTLQVGRSRLLVQPAHAENSALVTLRVLLSDPFAAAAATPYPVRAPRSCSILDRVDLGPSIDAQNSDVLLAGQHIIVTAVSGGGKSTLVRRLAEFVTACVDAVAVDIDPTGRGLGPLRGCAARSAHSKEVAEPLLEWLLERAITRVGLLPDLQDEWEPTAEAPAIVVFVDEYRRLTRRGKELVLELLTYSRKTKISVVLCTTDATSDALGDAIADSIGVRVLMPCRAADVPVVTAISTAIGQGWLPHLLIPSPSKEEPADAGRFYLVAPTHREPVLRYAPRLDPERAADVARERIAAGLCVLPASDPAPSGGSAPISAAPGSGALPDPAPEQTPAVVAQAPAAAGAPALPEIGTQLLSAFAAAGNPPWLTTTQLGDHLAKVDPKKWARWDGQPNRPLMIGRTLGAELRRAGLDIPRPRLDPKAHPDRPTVVRLADVRAALGR